MAVRAVIFDYKTLLMQPRTSEALQAGSFLQWLRGRGLRWCLLTDPLSADQQAAFLALGYLSPDVHISKADIPSGKNRGSPRWIDAVTARLGVARHELLYIGCTALDWRTAINSGVLYIHAGWAATMPPRTTSLTAKSPADAQGFLEFFLLGPARWSYRLDAGYRTLRSLLPAGATLPSTGPRSHFTPSARPCPASHCGSARAPHARLADDGGCSAPMPFSASIRQQAHDQRAAPRLLDKAASLCTAITANLLVRASDAPDTSLARWEAVSGDPRQRVDRHPGDHGLTSARLPVQLRGKR